MSKWLPEALLGALLLAAVLLLVAPRRPPRRLELPLAAAAAPPPAASQAPEPAAARRLAPPGQVAALFGWSEPAASARAPAGPPPPTEASWLKPVGFVVGEGGLPSYVFKDTKANAVLTLVPKVENRGWLLLEAREKDFLLLYKGTQYVVKRNE